MLKAETLGWTELLCGGFDNAHRGTRCNAVHSSRQRSNLKQNTIGE